MRMSGLNLQLMAAVRSSFTHVQLILWEVLWENTITTLRLNILSIYSREIFEKIEKNENKQLHMALKIANNVLLFIFFWVEEKQNREISYRLSDFVIANTFLSQWFIHKYVQPRCTFGCRPWSGLWRGPETARSWFFSCCQDKKTEVSTWEVKVDKNIPRLSVSNSSLQIRSFSIHLMGVETALELIIIIIQGL